MRQRGGIFLWVRMVPAGLVQNLTSALMHFFVSTTTTTVALPREPAKWFFVLQRSRAVQYVSLCLRPPPTPPG